MFVFSSDQMSSSPLVESAIKFTEKSQELTEHITALLGSLSSSDTSSALLYATEGMEVSSQHLEQNLRKVQLVEADKIISSAICTANQKDKEKLPENEQTAARKKLLNLTKNIYRKCQHILNDFNQNDIKLSSSVVELATEYETLVKTLPGLSDTEETKHWIQNLGKSLLSLSEYIQDDSSDKEPFTLKTVGEPFTKILTEEIDEDDDGKVLLFFVEMVSPVDEQEKEEAILQLAHLRTTAPKVLVKFLESKLTIIYEDADRSLSPEV